MKKYIIFAIVVLGTVASCSKKPYCGMDNGNPTQVRKVRYVFYTNENFAGNTKNITVSLRMRNNHRDIFDSALAIMKVEEIPDFNHRIIVEKLVPGNDTATLAVSFQYYIQDVGYSWHVEEFPAGDTLKVVNYAFK